MVEQTQQQKIFAPDEIILACVGDSKFDAVKTLKDDTLKQMMMDLPNVVEESFRTIREWVQSVGIPVKEFVINGADPMNPRSEMTKHIKNNPETKFLVIYVASGHGMVVDG